MVKKGLTILGSTGSIGQQTLAVARYQTELSIYALTANTAVDLLVDQCEVYHPSVAVIADPNCYGSLVTKLAERGLQTEARSGVEGLRSVAVDDEVSHVMAAIVGSSGLMPTYSAAEAGKTVLLANKEALVMSGRFLCLPLLTVKVRSSLSIASTMRFSSVWGMSGLWA